LGARNLLFAYFIEKQIPRFARDDNFNKRDDKPSRMSPGLALMAAASNATLAEHPQIEFKGQ